MDTKVYDVIIIGGGASGLSCAIGCARKGFSTLVIEKNDRIGKKIISSGNGRGNISNTILNKDCYNNSSFVGNVIENYDTQKIIQFFKSLGLLTKVEDGRIYPHAETSNSIVNCFTNALYNLNVEFANNTTARKIVKTNENYQILCDNTTYCACNVVLAGGSRATFGEESYNLAQQLGHAISKIQPALTTLSCPIFKSARGVRAKVNATLTLANGNKFSESGEFLFKDDCISGVLAFRLSTHIARQIAKENNSQAQLSIDFAQDISIEELSQFISQQQFPTMLQGIVHSAIANIIISNTIMDRSAMMTKFKADNLAEKCKNFVVSIDGLGTMSNAQVACGGISCDEFCNKSLQSKISKGLYACGEILDIDGECGGYNLHWAWASGLTVADSIGEFNAKVK